MSEQMRKVQITINNPQDCNLDHDTIKLALMRFNPTYFCLCDEIATTGTLHTHIYMCSGSPFRFSTLKKRLPTAHIERAYGTSHENRDYLLKQGKWTELSKADTSVPGTFEEWGIIPDEKTEKNPGMSELIDQIKTGKTTAEIINDNPKFGFRTKDIDILRQTLNTEKYAAQNRSVEVYYLYGATGSGKTRSIFTKHGARDICRVTHYGSVQNINFDAYFGQEVLVFEEFQSQISIGDMLNYLDVYPLMLPARYADKVACYNTVYITSNLPLERQYEYIQRSQIETWRAFLRRIDHIIEFFPDGSTAEHKKEEYV